MSPERKLILQAGLCSCGAGLILYVSTAAPTVTFEFSGYMAAAADHPGVPNVPGYPVWTFLGWVWIRVVEWLGLAGSQGAARALNLFSAMCGALTCGLLSALITGTEAVGRTQKIRSWKR